MVTRSKFTISIIFNRVSTTYVIQYYVTRKNIIKLYDNSYTYSE